MDEHDADAGSSNPIGPAERPSLPTDRAKILDRLAGPIQFLGLVVMVCELSLGMTTAFVHQGHIQWFLCIAMVTMFFLTVLGFFYLIVRHHEKLYPPALYPDAVVGEVFVRRHIGPTNSPSAADMREFVSDFLVAISRPFPLPDLVQVLSAHFGIRESDARRALSDMRGAGLLLVDDNGGTQLASVASTQSPPSVAGSEDHR